MTDPVEIILSAGSLKDVPREQLEWLTNESEERVLERGYFLKSGDVTEELLVILEGILRVYTVQNNQKKTLFELGPGELTGLMPFSRMKASPVYSEVIVPMRALYLPKAKFRELIVRNYELAETIVHLLLDRVRLFTSLHFQNEKLMALGKLSAGLAHELNNPAAAIRRSADELKETIRTLPNSFNTMISAGVAPKDLATASALLERAFSTKPERLPVLERRRKEDELTEWLEKIGTEWGESAADECSETLVDFGFFKSELVQLQSRVAPSALPKLIGWLASVLQAEKAAREIGIASRRISDLVQSVKNYTRMDQVHDMQKVAIQEGIRNTLVMMEHKIRHNSVTLHEELSADLPDILGFPGELTQVWTNLIDNALDAMPNGGDLTIRAFAEQDKVIFTVNDTGTGIPEENLERIFDPFFTTKGVGEGTGVGLDVVRVIVGQHKGKIDVTSQPGKTEFKISFPRYAEEVETESTVKEGATA